MKWFSVNRLLHVMGSLSGLSLAIVMAGNVVAEEGATRWLRAGPELVKACREERTGSVQGEGGRCSSYLLGYLDGNVEVTFSDTMPSPYMQNLLRTRAPNHPQIEALKSVVYCIDSVEDLSSAVAALEPDAVASRSSAQVVVAILDRHHRCRS